MKLPRSSPARYALFASVFAFAAILAYALAPARHPAAAPMLTFTTVKGEFITPRELQGRVLLVNFWSTSCVVCMQEMPKLAALHQRYRPLGLETIAVAMSYDRPDFVLQYADRTRLPFTVALDLGGEAAREYGNVDATPTTFVIDKRGQIVKRYLGQPDFAELERLLDAKLAEAA
jgi:peroxiredoxin